VTNQKIISQIKNEIKWGSMPISTIIKNGTRFDASVYDIEAIKARKIIENCKFEKKPLFDKENGFVENAYYLGRFRRIFVDNGENIFQPADIMELLPESDKFISKKTNVDFDSLRLEENQIVLTRSGTIGYCCVVKKFLNGKLFSDDLIRMKVKNLEDLGYVYAFLKTSFGHKLIVTNNYGSVIDHLEPEHLETINVPNPPKPLKDKIYKKIMKAFELRDEANFLLIKANELLFDKLKLKPLKKLKPKFFHGTALCNFVKDSNSFNSRIDSSYHIPIIDEIEKELKNTESEITNIGDERVTKQIILAGRFKRIYVAEDFGVPFLGGKEIIQFDFPDLKYLSLKNHKKRIKEELTLHENMIIITCSGTIGKTLLLPKYLDGWTGSQHMIKVIPSKKMNPGYLYAFLASDYGYQLLTRYSYGTNVDEINDKQVAQIPIPIPKKREIIDEIGDLVMCATKKRNEAYELEHEAIKLVSDMIINNQ